MRQSKKYGVREKKREKEGKRAREREREREGERANNVGKAV